MGAVGEASVDSTTEGALVGTCRAGVADVDRGVASGVDTVRRVLSKGAPMVCAVGAVDAVGAVGAAGAGECGPLAGCGMAGGAAKPAEGKDTRTPRGRRSAAGGGVGPAAVAVPATADDATLRCVTAVAACGFADAMLFAMFGCAGSSARCVAEAGSSVDGGETTSTRVAGHGGLAAPVCALS
jgi:hypothetical protein